MIERSGGSDVDAVDDDIRTLIDDLLETILLTSDANVEPTADPDRPAIGMQTVVAVD